MRGGVGVWVLVVFFVVFLFFFLLEVSREDSGQVTASDSCLFLKLLISTALNFFNSCLKILGGHSGATS